MGTHQGDGNNPHLQGYIGKQAQDTSPFGIIQSFILAPAFAELFVCIFSSLGMCLNEAFWQWIMLWSHLAKWTIYNGFLPYHLLRKLHFISHFPLPPGLDNGRKPVWNPLQLICVLLFWMSNTHGTWEWHEHLTKLILNCHPQSWRAQFFAFGAPINFQFITLSRCRHTI